MQHAARHRIRFCYYFAEIHRPLRSLMLAVLLEGDAAAACTRIYTPTMYTNGIELCVRSPELDTCVSLPYFSLYNNG